MVEITAIYEGELHTIATHAPSAAVVSTDAPKDNEGRGESFSPTDLVATALGTCMLTIMGIVAKRHDLPLVGGVVRVEKHMITEPVRRIGKLAVYFRLPPGIPEDKRPLLMRAAASCPVHQSIHPDIEVPVVYDWQD